MIIRLGYVSIAKTLENITASSTMTYTNFLKLDEDKRYEKLEQVTISNLLDLEKIITYNIKNNIHFYRITSSLIPLYTHPSINLELDKFKPYFDRIKRLINKANMRVDMHPSEYCVLNSTRKEVIEKTIIELDYHYKVLKLLGVKDKVVILHIGSGTFGKKNSLARFINSFNSLPEYLRRAIVIENDDKIFNIDDCLYLKGKLGVRVVLDYHHHLCNHESDEINFEEIFSNWEVPKIHFSSPKSNLKKDFRSHNEFINIKAFMDFLEIVRFQNNLDIMLEAKGKDEALFKLVRQLKYYGDYYFIDDTSFEI